MTETPRTALSRQIASRIQFTRQSRGLAQYHLENLAGIASGQVCRIEAGVRGNALSVEVLLKIANALQVDVGWLITGIVPTGTWKPPEDVIQAMKAKTKMPAVKRLPPRVRPAP